MTANFFQSWLGVKKLLGKMNAQTERELFEKWISVELGDTPAQMKGDMWLGWLARSRASLPANDLNAAIGFKRQPELSQKNLMK